MLTPEQMAEWERHGWTLEKEAPGEFQQWVKDPEGYAGVVLLYGSEQPYIGGPAQYVAEALVLLGIAPPGYRLVPDSVVREAAWLLCKMAEGDAPTHWDRTRAPEVAAALLGESTDLSPASGR